LHHKLFPQTPGLWGIVFCQLWFLVISFDDINKFGPLVFRLYLGNLKRLLGE